jgi:hypothetical protein
MFIPHLLIHSKDPGAPLCAIGGIAFAVLLTSTILPWLPLPNAASMYSVGRAKRPFRRLEVPESSEERAETS